MLFLTILDDIGQAIIKALRTLFMSLCDVIYRLIVITYDIFEKIGTASLLSNDTVMGIYRKIGLVLGLFMLFRISFSIINYVINPDLIGDKQKGVGNIVKKVLIVIVLLGITPSLFREAYVFQNILVKQNVIGKIISGDSISFSQDNGKDLAWYGFSSFYKVSSDYVGLRNVENNSSITENTIYNICPEMDPRDDPNNMSLVERSFRNSNSFKFAYNCLNETINVKNAAGDKYQFFVIDFEGWGIVCLIVGALLFWLILMYTIQLGVRLIQLAYLQLIAPIPIIMYLDPKNNDSLSKWAKQCLTTFLDFFIRTGIMYFVIFVIHLLINNETTFLNAFDGVSAAYVNIIMIIALLIFAKRVPKLLEEVIPLLKNSASLDFGLKMPKEMKQVGGAIAGATTAGAIGLIGGKGFGRVSGLLSGAAKGGVSGAKGTKLKDIASARAKQNVTNRQNREQGNTLGVRMGAKMRETFGFDSEGYSDIRKMLNQWDDGRNTYSRMISKGIGDLNASTSYSDFRKLDFHDEWVKALKDKDAANTVLKDKASKLAYANANGTADEIKIAQKEYDDAQKVYETADRVKSAMDKKYSGDAQRYANYKFYNKGGTPRPGTGTTNGSGNGSSNGGLGNGPTNGSGNGAPNGGLGNGPTNGSGNGAPNGGLGNGPTNGSGNGAPNGDTGNSDAENGIPNENLSSETSDSDSASTLNSTSPIDDSFDNNEQQSDFINTDENNSDESNFDRIYAGASEFLRDEVRSETNNNSTDNNSDNSSGFRRRFRRKKGDDEDLSAQAELNRERARQAEQNQELEDARKAIKSGGVNPDAIDAAANERYNAAVDILNNNGDNNN